MWLKKKKKSLQEVSSTVPPHSHIHLATDILQHSNLCRHFFCSTLCCLAMLSSLNTPAVRYILYMSHPKKDSSTSFSELIKASRRTHSCPHYRAVFLNADSCSSFLISYNFVNICDKGCKCSDSKGSNLCLVQKGQ